MDPIPLGAATAFLHDAVMVRLPRLVLPGLPYHVTQRGNRRQRTFFEEADYALYRDLLTGHAAAIACRLAGSSKPGEPAPVAALFHPFRM